MASDLSNGSVFAGRYRIERRIATGGMGAVYEVVHLETNRKRALKVMHENFVQSEELRNRFRQEARVAAEIESEYIVDVFDAGIDEASGMPFLVMELLRGEELAKRLRRTGPLSPAEAVTYLYQTALALEKTHRASIVHRDLKPDNLFLCEREDGPPRVKVLDFGIAKMVAEGATQAQATRSLGTPLYMAPEQFVMDSPISPATDIFALGMIAFTLLVGKPYWHEEAKSGASVFAFAATAAIGPQESATARAAKLGVNLPEAFGPWFARVTARKPAERFQSALTAVRGLAEALSVPIPGAHAMTSSGIIPPGSVPTPVVALPMGPPPPMRAPMQSHSFLQVATPMPMSSPSSTAGVATPVGTSATPFNTGVTSAPVAKRSPPFALIGAGAAVLLAGLGVAIYLATSSSSEMPPAAATEASALPAPSAAVAPQPEVKPQGPAPVQTAAPSAAASPSAAPSVATTDATKVAAPTKSTKTGGTAPPTKKPLWTND